MVDDAVGRRRGRHVGGGAAGGGRHRLRVRRPRRGLPGPGAGPVRPLRPAPCHQRPPRRPLPAPLRRVGPGALVRPQGHAVLPRHRHRPHRHPEGGLAGELPPRPAEPPGDHAGPAAHPRGLRRVPLDRRAVPALRLLPRERLRRRPPPGAGRAGQGPHRSAGLPPRGAAGWRLPVPRRSPQQPRLRHRRVQDRLAPALRPGRGDPCRRRRRAGLRELHRRRRDGPHRARLLQLRGRQRGHHLREPRRTRRPPPPEHLRGQPRRVLRARLRHQVEAVRQIRGDSPNPVPDAKVSFVSSGPFVVPASSVVFGTDEALG